ncbi:hypothetical protein FA13DRAFT_230780 [Coprinellus micaceus]|uniref:DUF6699 domain-containing protein n=1 Tax=Coprinellus micaceus TaxID=71717 RepID=A0A4Y7TG27_COPMI|nr:hypothetical protein FA13DRAFT_230780 [Coprinellus micaceus]
MSVSTNKRVKFASTNRVYSPIPSTPSPCASSSSLPSSPDLPTPPPEREYEVLGEDYGAQYPRSPYPQHAQANFDLVFFPELEVPKELHIHTLLGHVGPYSEPEIPYDLSMAISLVKEQFGVSALMEPATQPPVQNLTVACPDFLLWEVEVKTGAVYPGAYVSVDDVLTAIYSNLRQPVNYMEYGSLGQNRGAVDAAYFARLTRIHDPALKEQEALKGVKRIDFLRGKNRFMGLSVMHRPGEEPWWELNVS